MLLQILKNQTLVDKHMKDITKSDFQIQQYCSFNKQA